MGSASTASTRAKSFLINRQKEPREKAHKNDSRFKGIDSCRVRVVIVPTVVIVAIFDSLDENVDAIAYRRRLLDDAVRNLGVAPKSEDILRSDADERGADGGGSIWRAAGLSEGVQERHVADV